jgi:hypothetical protein
VVEQCHEYDECEAYVPFVEADKPVFEVEYVDRAGQAAGRAAEVCPLSNTLGLRTLVLPLALDGSFREGC